MIMKRVKMNVEYVINPLSAIGLKVYKLNPFIGVDMETGMVLVDTGEEAT